MAYRLKKFVRKLKWNLKYLLSLPNKFLYYSGIIKNTNAFPDLLIIGLPKSATWWLAHNLVLNPAFFLGCNPNGKGEIRYFSINFDKSLNFYFNIFTGKKQDLKFEKSPDYCLISEKRINLIKKLNPNIKIILMLRDPVERAISHAKMDLLNSTGKKFEEVSPETFKAHFLKTANIFNYEKICLKWKKFFDKEHLLIILQDQIVADPEKVLKKVYNFLDVTYDTFKHELSPINITKNIVLPESQLIYLRQLNEKNNVFYQKMLQEQLMDNSIILK